MSKNYAKGLAHDQGGVDLQDFSVPFPAIATTVSENATASSTLTLNDNTTSLEIGAAVNGAVIKWIGVGAANASVIAVAGTANFDNFIPVNDVRKFVVPIETLGTSSIVGLGVQAGTYRTIAYKSLGVGSILLTQY